LCSMTPEKEVEEEKKTTMSENSAEQSMAS
jgi:hypothetical protein